MNFQKKKLGGKISPPPPPGINRVNPLFSCACLYLLKQLLFHYLSFVSFACNPAQRHSMQDLGVLEVDLRFRGGLENFEVDLRFRGR